MNESVDVLIKKTELILSQQILDQKSFDDCIEKLLQYCIAHGNSHELEHYVTIVQSIFVRSCSRSLSSARLFFEYLPNLPNMLDFIQISAKVLLFCDSEVVSFGLSQLRLIMDFDSTLICPIFAQLVDCPLSKESIMDIWSLITVYLEVIDEDHLPILCTILLKNADAISLKSLISKIRIDVIV